MKKLSDNYIVIEGNAVDGLQFTGPFNEYDDALEWAEKNADGEWLIAGMEMP